MADDLSALRTFVSELLGIAKQVGGPDRWDGIGRGPDRWDGIGRGPAYG